MTFPDIEALVLTFLTQRVNVPVHTSVPSNRPPAFILLWRNGGASSNRVVDRPQVTVEAWSQDSVRASELAEQCRSALLNEASTIPSVSQSTEISGPYSTTDETTETPRYRFTMQLTVRARR